MPRLNNFSAGSGIFDKIKIKSIEPEVCCIPYSLLVASTESLPEEGESFETTTYIPFEFNVKSITLQINQCFDKPSNVCVNILGNNYIFNMKPDQPTLNLDVNLMLKKACYQRIVIENMKNDEGDVSACVVMLHGFIK